MKADLTKRQTQVVNLICQGLSNKQISKELDISIRTVESHISKVFVTFSVTNRTCLANKVNNINNKDFKNINEQLSQSIIKYALSITSVNNPHLANALAISKENVSQEFLKTLKREEATKLNYMVWSTTKYNK